MIFVTIGSLFPFDRLVRVMDAIAPTMPEHAFFAQIGEGKYEPTHMAFARMLSRREFTAKINEATLIVAHAGMGSVIQAMESRKPIVLLPRIFEQGEHTTDHQMATARWLAEKPGVYVAMEDADLGETIKAALAGVRGEGAMTASAPPEFLAKIRDFILHA
jgi:UDP-N-acetylglucosamine transferase subunit ALG13